MELLDRIDARRHDTMAILDAANAYGSQPSMEDGEEVDLWEHSGMDAVQHPFSALLPEGRNGTCVVRDLDGSLNFLWQESSTSDRWLIGPLYREHLLGIEEVEELLEDDSGWLAATGIALAPEELAELLAALPTADGPVVSY